MVRPARLARLPRLGGPARAGAPRAGERARLAGPGRGRAGRAVRERAPRAGRAGREPPRSLRAAATMSDQAPKVPEEMFKEVKYYAVGDIDPQVPRRPRPAPRVPGPSSLRPRARARAHIVWARPPGARRRGCAEAGPPGAEQAGSGAGGEGGERELVCGPRGRGGRKPGRGADPCNRGRGPGGLRDSRQEWAVSGLGEEGMGRWVCSGALRRLSPSPRGGGPGCCLVAASPASDSAPFWAEFGQGRPSRGSLGGLGSPDAQTVGPSVVGASAGGAGKDVGPGLLRGRLAALVWQPPRVAGLRLGHLVCDREPSVYHQRIRVS